jgi:hypothetical protein
LGAQITTMISGARSGFARVRAIAIGLRGGER